MLELSDCNRDCVVPKAKIFTQDLYRKHLPTLKAEAGQGWEGICSKKDQDDFSGFR